MDMTTFLLIAIFLSTAGLVLGVGFWVNRDQSLNRRLDQIQGQSDGRSTSGGESQVWQAKVAKLAQPFAHLSMPTDIEDATYLRVRFMNAGLREAYWPQLYFGA